MNSWIEEHHMIAKYLFAGAAASALMATVALAQTPATTATNSASMSAASGLSFSRATGAPRRWSA
jgi:hypothetical protein